jgi:molybdate transport system permease protein
VDVAALRLSLALSTLTTLALLAIGLPIAHWLTTTRWRGKILVEAVVALPLVLPPTVLGFYLLVAFGPRSPLGRGFASLTGHTLAFSFEGLLLASILYSLPFAVQPFAAAFAAVDRSLIETAWCLGASKVRTFTRVVMPLARPGIVAGTALALMETLADFGTVSYFGVQTFTTGIYRAWFGLQQPAAAAQLGAVLMLFVLVLVLIERASRGGAPTPSAGPARSASTEASSHSRSLAASTSATA